MSQRHVLGPATLDEFHRALDDLVRVCVDFKLASPQVVAVTDLDREVLRRAAEISMGGCDLAAPTRPQTPCEPGGVPSSSGPTAGQIIDQGHSDGVDDHALPTVAAAGAWRPRAATPEELDDARTVLVVHRLDPQTGRCAACAADCPCPPALDAGRVLAQAGAWNTVPFTNPTGWQTDQAPASAEAGWLTRLVRRLPWTAAAE